MIENNKLDDNFIVHCDGCPEYVIIETSDFTEMIKELKELGWNIKYKGGGGSDEYAHYCDVCTEKEINEKKLHFQKKA